jgi:hypothetical protein
MAGAEAGRSPGATSVCCSGQRKTSRRSTAGLRRLRKVNGKRQECLIAARGHAITLPPLSVTHSNFSRLERRRPAARSQSLLAYSVVAAFAAVAVDSGRAPCRSPRRRAFALAEGTVLSGSGCWSAATRLRCSGFIVFLQYGRPGATLYFIASVSSILRRPADRAKNSTGRRSCQNDTAGHSSVTS